MKIHLDVCCLNRLFDDQHQARVSIETAAVQQVLELVESSPLSDYSSAMAQVEIERIPSPDRRRKVMALLPPKEHILPLSDSLLDVTAELQQLKL